MVREKMRLLYMRMFSIVNRDISWTVCTILTCSFSLFSLTITAGLDSDDEIQSLPDYEKDIEREIDASVPPGALYFLYTAFLRQSI